MKDIFVAKKAFEAYLISSAPRLEVLMYLLVFLTIGKYNDFNFKLFKFPKDLSQALNKELPAMLCFSNYSWNFELAYKFAYLVKEKNPNVITIFGGPNFPLENKQREEWLRKRPFVDIYVVGDGEESFTKIVDAWYETHNTDKVKQKEIPGCYSLVNDKLHKTGEFSPRIEDLDKIPSPYLKGYLDKFLVDSRLSPLLESNRGCPFTCTFCVDGTNSRSKVYHKSVTCLLYTSDAADE